MKIGSQKLRQQYITTTMFTPFTVSPLRSKVMLGFAALAVAACSEDATSNTTGSVTATPTESASTPVASSSPAPVQSSNNVGPAVVPSVPVVAAGGAPALPSTPQPATPEPTVTVPSDPTNSVPNGGAGGEPSTTPTEPESSPEPVESGGATDPGTEPAPEPVPTPTMDTEEPAPSVSAPPATDGVPLDPALLSQCSGSNPVICSFDVANGNYDVTVELGSEAAAANTRVLSELYRINLDAVATAAGQFSTHTFTVNVREEEHDGYNAPGGVLELRFDGDAPALHGVGVRAAPDAPTIFVAGDSTVCDWDPAYGNIIDPIERGWAQELSLYFGAGIAVANYADSGETAGGFYNKFFTPAVDLLREGDYVFIQFGHNDQKNQGDVDNYQSNIMRYVDAARNAGATPVLFTPVGRRGASMGNPGFAGLDEQARELAASEQIALIDLTVLSIAAYGEADDLASWFVDGTHFAETGAREVAGVVAGALAESELPLTAFLRTVP